MQQIKTALKTKGLGVKKKKRGGGLEKDGGHGMQNTIVHTEHLPDLIVENIKIIITLRFAEYSEQTEYYKLNKQKTVN